VRATPAPAQRNEPVRRDAKGRPLGRPLAATQHAQAASREPAEQLEASTPRTVTDELPARGTEPMTTAALTVEAREEPSVAAPTPAAQPAAIAPTATAAAARPSPPIAPQRLEAQASITDLDVEGSLGSSIVSRMLARVTPQLRSCYAEAAKRAGRNDFSALPVSFVIDESGSVRQLSAGKHALSELPGCATSALKRTRSERVPDVGTVQVRIKVAFTP